MHLSFWSSYSKNWKYDRGRKLRSNFSSNMTERNKHHKNSPRISHFQRLTQNWCVISFLLQDLTAPWSHSFLLLCWSYQIYPSYASSSIFTNKTIKNILFQFGWSTILLWGNSSGFFLKRRRNRNHWNQVKKKF